VIDVAVDDFAVRIEINDQAVDDFACFVLGASVSSM
jgi:hypothetical protein